MKMVTSEYNLSPDRIKEILEELGYRLTDRGAYWHSNAAFRNGDNSTALQIWKNSGVWRDFVQGTVALPFAKLLETHFGTNDKKVIGKYLTYDYVPSQKTSTQQDRIVMEKVYDESILDDLFPHYDFYNNKGIGSDVLEFLKGGYATKGKMLQRFVFPIYNEHSQIIGFSGRDMTNEKDAKWKHIGRKSKWIYPYYVPDGKKLPIEEAISDAGSVILVESIGDLLNLHQNNFKNVLVSFGLDISPSLLCHLMSLDVKKIIISFNNDSDKSVNRGARAAVKNYLKLLNHFDFNQLYVCLPTKTDFGEMEPKDFTSWSEKCECSFMERASSILSFAKKMRDDKDLPKSLIKNIEILESHVG